MLDDNFSRRETSIDPDAARREAFKALSNLARALHADDEMAASRMANQCLDLFEADLMAYKLTGEEPVRGHRAGDLSGAS